MEFNLKKSIDEYIPIDKTELESVEKTKDFLKNNENCFSRTNLKGHITAGALIMDKEGNVLLNHHKILDKWLLFGGHSDGDSNSLNVAKREIMEESGIAEFDDLNGKIFDIDVHLIPENTAKKEPAHYHYDIRVLFIVKNKEFKISDESTGAKWLSISEAKQLITNTNITRVLEKAYTVYINMKH